MEKYPRPDHDAVITPRNPVARCRVADLYDNYTPPPYVDSVYRLSLIPYGEIGEYVFFEDDPDHAYAVPFGETLIREMDSVQLAREIFVREK